MSYKSLAAFSTVIGCLLLCASALATPPERAAVLVMPVDFTIGQLTAGGIVETLADDSEMACRQVSSGLDNWLNRHPELTPVAYPELPEPDEAVVREHVALFDVAVGQALAMQTIRKGRRFDYSVGSGLAFLKESTGADKAIVLGGTSLRSTGGRTALKFFEFIMFGALSPLSGSMAYAGIVDLETGQIEWANYGSIGGLDVTEFAGACDAVDKLLESYPGGRLSIRQEGK